MLIGIVGDIGSGKTLFLTILCWKALERNIPVYANYTIKHPKAKKITPEKLINMKYRRALIALDECYAWLDARLSMSKRNRVLTYVIFQSRKRGLDIAYTAQLYGSVERRLRDLTDIVIVANKIRKKGKVRGFAYTVVAGDAIRKLFLPIAKAEKYFKRFDTYELVDIIEY